LQLEDGFVKQFEDMEKEMNVKIIWNAHILMPSEYIEKWRIMLWTKAFRPFFGGMSAFTKSTILGKIFGGGIAIKRVVFR
jgi:hypothetical protein